MTFVRVPVAMSVPMFLLRGGVAAVALLATLSGCSNRTIVGRAGSDFTAYYNAYYNARKSFDVGMEALRQAHTPVSRSAYLAVYPPTVGASQANFDGAVRKGAEVLRKHPGSRWTDDALMLIGQSYYHLGQYAPAEQKFREVLFEWRGRDGKPSPRAHDARLWLARTLVAARRPQAAADFFAQSFAQQADLSRLDLARLRLVRADFYVTLAAWDDAADDLRNALPDVRDGRLRARASYLLGQVEETRGHFADARDAFAAATRRNPDDALALAARVGQMRMQAAAGDPVGAIQAATALVADERNAEFRADLTVVQARLLASAARSDEARDLLHRTLRGDARDRTAQRGALYYALADLYRTGYGDYLSAALYYDSAAAVLPAASASVTLPRGSVTATPTREAVTDAAQRKDVFGAFAAARRRLSEADSLLRVGALDDAAFAQFVRELRERRARELAAANRAAAAAADAQAFGGSLQDQGLAPPATSQPLTTTQPAASGDAGFLYYRDPSRVRANRVAFEQTWGNRPLVPNWRRRAAISGAGAVQLAASERLAPGSLDRVGGVEDNLPEVDVSAIPRTPEATARVREQRAEARYALANAFFLRMAEPDSARIWLRRIVEEDAESSVAPRALYALAEVERARGDTAAARTTLEQVLALYPDRDFADRARQSLGLSSVVRPDSSAEGQRAYADALSAAEAGPDSIAYARLLDVAIRYRGQSAGAQALLALAYRVQERANGDSLALRAPLPADSALLARAGLRPDSAGAPVQLDHVYRALAATYPGTRYAEHAQAVLAALSGGQGPGGEPGVPSTEDEGDLLEGRRQRAPARPAAGEQAPPAPGRRPSREQRPVRPID